MANQGQKTKRWTAQDEYNLIKNVEKHVLCLTKAFEATSKEIQRSPKAVQAHWYMKTSKHCGRTLFMTVSGKHVAVNRKNAKGQPIKVSIFKRLLAILKLSY